MQQATRQTDRQANRRVNPQTDTQQAAKQTSRALTVFLVVGGGVHPVVLVGQGDELKLLDDQVDGPGVGDKAVDVRHRLAGPVVRQVCNHYC